MSPTWNKGTFSEESGIAKKCCDIGKADVVPPPASNSIISSKLSTGWFSPDTRLLLAFYILTIYEK